MSRTLTTEEKEILKIMVKAFPLMSGGKEVPASRIRSGNDRSEKKWKRSEADSLAAS